MKYEIFSLQLIIYFTEKFQQFGIIIFKKLLCQYTYIYLSIVNFAIGYFICAINIYTIRDRQVLMKADFARPKIFMTTTEMNLLPPLIMKSKKRRLVHCQAIFTDWPHWRSFRLFRSEILNLSGLPPLLREKGYSSALSSIIVHYNKYYRCQHVVGINIHANNRFEPTVYGKRHQA